MEPPCQSRIVKQDIYRFTEISLYNPVRMQNLPAICSHIRKIKCGRKFQSSVVPHVVGNGITAHTGNSMDSKKATKSIGHH